MYVTPTCTGSEVEDRPPHPRASLTHFLPVPLHSWPGGSCLRSCCSTARCGGFCFGSFPRRWRWCILSSSLIVAANGPETLTETTSCSVRVDVCPVFQVHVAFTRLLVTRKVWKGHIFNTYCRNNCSTLKGCVRVFFCVHWKSDITFWPHLLLEKSSKLKETRGSRWSW